MSDRNIRNIPDTTWRRFRILAVQYGLTHAGALALLLDAFPRSDPPTPDEYAHQRDLAQRIESAP